MDMRKFTQSPSAFEQKDDTQDFLEDSPFFPFSQDEENPKPQGAIAPALENDLEPKRVATPAVENDLEFEDIIKGFSLSPICSQIPTKDMEYALDSSTYPFLPNFVSTTQVVKTSTVVTRQRIETSLGMQHEESEKKRIKEPPRYYLTDDPKIIIEKVLQTHKTARGLSHQSHVLRQTANDLYNMVKIYERDTQITPLKILQEEKMVLTAQLKDQKKRNADLLKELGTVKNNMHNVALENMALKKKITEIPNPNAPIEKENAVLVKQIASMHRCIDNIKLEKNALEGKLTAALLDLKKIPPSQHTELPKVEQLMASCMGFSSRLLCCSSVWAHVAGMYASVYHTLKADESMKTTFELATKAMEDEAKLVREQYLQKEPRFPLSPAQKDELFAKFLQGPVTMKELCSNTKKLLKIGSSTISAPILGPSHITSAESPADDIVYVEKLLPVKDKDKMLVLFSLLNYIMLDETMEVELSRKQKTDVATSISQILHHVKRSNKDLSIFSVARSSSSAAASSVASSSSSAAASVPPAVPPIPTSPTAPVAPAAPPVPNSPTAGSFPASGAAVSAGLAKYSPPRATAETVSKCPSRSASQAVFARVMDSHLNKRPVSQSATLALDGGNDNCHEDPPVKKARPGLENPGSRNIPVLPRTPATTTTTLSGPVRVSIVEGSSLAYLNTASNHSTIYP